MSDALQLGLDALWQSAGEHRAELERLIPIAQRLARERGRITIEDVRREVGLLDSRGRDLSYLGALGELAGLKRTGTFKRSKLPDSHGNLQAEWELPCTQT